MRKVWFWVLVIATAIYLLVVPAWMKRQSQKLPIYGQVPSFELTERSGKKVTLKDLEGKVWIADFIFTRCAGICPIMTNRMKLVQDKIYGNRKIVLVSFSVDSEYDTPEKLNSYANRFGIKPDQWLFLTGDKKQIHKLSQQHFHLGVTDVPEPEREAPDQTVEHSSKFVLVDQQGKIRGYYASEETGFLNQLVKDANGLLQTSRP